MDLMEKEGKCESEYIYELLLVLVVKSGDEATFPRFRNYHEELGETLESLKPKGDEFFTIRLC